MRSNEFRTRELSEIELFQIGGGYYGCGPGCPCNGSSATPSDDGTLLFSQDCGGSLYVTHIGPPPPVRAI
jgi:hypothetical protein